MKSYINYNLIDQYPNKYNLKPNSIKKLRILDWRRLKKNTWLNTAMLSGTWWCHLEGSNAINKEYNDEDEFWIGFNEDNNNIDYHFYSYGGMCGYEFKNFYKMADIENEYDMNVQINTIRWLNMMIDEGILGL